MRKWVLAGLLVTGVVTAVCLLAPKPHAPAPPGEPELPAEPTVPPSPVVLPAVVDVTDIDHLLDPPAPLAEPAAKPGLVVIAMDDPPAPQAAFTPVSAPARIPLAAD